MEQQQQYTPGPWEYDPNDGEIRAQEDGSVLFDVHNATDEQVAIAEAAPDLLAALEDITLLGCCLDHAQKIADAAIRRARGED